jgi:hypothetical protein
VVALRSMRRQNSETGQSRRVTSPRGSSAVHTRGGNWTHASDSVADMERVIERPRDCPECSSSGSVIRDFCEVCYAEVGEYCEPRAGPILSETDAPIEPLDANPTPHPPTLHPSIRFRFTDVVEELRAIAEMASQAVEVEGSRLAAACRRAESLLRILRLQFMEDVVFGDRQHGLP